MPRDPDEPSGRKRERADPNLTTPGAPSALRARDTDVADVADAADAADAAGTDVMPAAKVAELVAAQKQERAAGGRARPTRDDDDELPTGVLAQELAPPPSPRASGKQPRAANRGTEQEEGPTGVVAPPLPVDAAAFSALDAAPARQAAQAATSPLPLDADDFEPTSVLPAEELSDSLHELATSIRPRTEVIVPATTSPSPRESGYLGAIAIGLLASIAISTAGWAVFFRSSASGPSDATPPSAAVVMDAGRSATDNDPGAPRALSTDASPLEQLQPTPGESFESSFARRQSEIDRCVDAHSTDLGEIRVIHFRFQIRASGAVKTASIRPRPLRQTHLGDCLRATARRARFAPQPKAVTITIPLKLRSH